MWRLRRDDLCGEGVAGMAGLLCRVGLHRWRTVRSDTGETSLHCTRCGRDGDDQGVRAALRAGWWT